MGWDWVIDTAKGLAAIFIVWLSKILWQQTKPFVKWVGRIIAVIKTVDDISDRQTVEFNKLLAMVNISPHPYYIIDENGGMTYANQAWLDLTGFRDEKEAYGLGYLRAVHPDDRKEVSDQRVMLAKTESSYNGSVRFRNLRTGEEITKTCVSQTYNNRRGDVAGTIGTLY